MWKERTSMHTKKRKKNSTQTIKTANERYAGLHAMLIGVVRLAQKKFKYLVEKKNHIYNWNFL